MDGDIEQSELFTPDEVDGGDDQPIVINERCRIQTQGDQNVVVVGSLPLYPFRAEDQMARAYAMVCLVDQGWAQQSEVARAFECDVRTVRRNQRRYEEGGLIALGRPSGYPRGRPRVPKSRSEQLNEWKAEGESHHAMARRLGISTKAVRKQLRRLGWEPQKAQQYPLIPEVAGGDPNLSGAASEAAAGGDPNLSGAASEAAAGGDPNLSGAESGKADPRRFGMDPADRWLDRLLAWKGKLNDAPPLFRSSDRVPAAGVLLAIPALVDSGVFDIAKAVYGNIGPAFYGLRTSVMTFLLMALLRIKRPEGLKTCSPVALGRVLGLDRAPEVKTLRRKLSHLAAMGRAIKFSHDLAKRRVETRGHAMGFLYVDGHVRAYHGKRDIPKAHLARIRLSMPATTDYWVNDALGDPLFVVTTEANEGLVQMFPPVLNEVRSLVGDRRVTIVFDRGGWSPKLFCKLICAGFDILTYRKGKTRKLAWSRFKLREGTIDGTKRSYRLADQGIYLMHGPYGARRRLHLRQVTRLSDDGHQTPIITSRRDLSALEVAYRMFERWRQENFFKYLRQEYALDVLVDYGVELADPTRMVPNPLRRKASAEVKKAYEELNLLAAEYGAEACSNIKDVRTSLRKLKAASAPYELRIRQVLEKIKELEGKRDAIPSRVPIQQLNDGDVIKLAVERKHLTDLFKMVAFQAESDLVRLVAPHYRRAEQEGRSLIRSALASDGVIHVTDDILRVSIAPMSSPHRTQALVALCDQLNDMDARFPGSNLRIRYDVLPEPPLSMAFPGPRDQVTN
jgi:transposase